MNEGRSDDGGLIIKREGVMMVDCLLRGKECQQRWRLK